MQYQLIGFTLGFLLVILGVAQMIPALLEFAEGGTNTQAFFVSGVIAMFVGGALALSNKNFKAGINARQTFLLTTLGWVFMSAASAIPLYMADIDISLADAMFEATSGITTTGSTVLSGLDDMSRGVLLWRSITQWIGGVGIIAFAIIILPFLNVGGMQLLQTEFSDQSEKIMPRTKEIVTCILLIYCGLTFVCAMGYIALGMHTFDAFNHAMTTVCTGGFSTYDASFGHFASYWMDMVAALFMLLSALPFILLIKMFFRGKFAFLEDDQFKALISMLVIFITIMTLWLWLTDHYDLANSIHYATFNILSILTTTGYATTDYMVWGSFSTMFFFFLTYMGASAGSTSGGIKTIRIVILFKAMLRHIKRLIYPHGVFVIHYQGKPLDREMVLNVLGFLFLFVMANAIITIALAATGLDFLTAISAAGTAIANVGPGVGPVIGPAGNFSSLSDTAKWILCFAMILGRLELMTVIVLFARSYWRD